jgi:hypothetical protein
VAGVDPMLLRDVPNKNHALDTPGLNAVQIFHLAADGKALDHFLSVDAPMALSDSIIGTPEPGGHTLSVELQSGDERFTADDLYELSALVVTTWRSAAHRDWSVAAGALDWSCTRTADHAVDCVYGPAFFLASRREDGYPEVGDDMTLGDAATPSALVASLEIATRVLVAVVNDAPADARAAIFQRPSVITGAPADFLPRGGMELILHAHDVSAGLAMPFEPGADLCHRLREHTRPWPMWGVAWNGALQHTDDPWADLLRASGRQRLTS